MFKVFGVMLALALAVVFGRAALMPAELRVERSLLVNATPKQVMPFLDDFHGWGAWSPLEQQNVNLTTSFAGPARGVGAVYNWSTAGEGNAGRMEIVAQQPDTMVRVRLDQARPQSRTVLLEFQLAPEDGGTRITAISEQHRSLLKRLRSPLGEPTKPIEDNLDEGLINLKLAVEAP
ncbi:MAG: SRPBCC family protein [Polymorphobacter sp.]